MWIDRCFSVGVRSNEWFRSHSQKNYEPTQAHSLHFYLIIFQTWYLFACFCIEVIKMEFQAKNVYL